MTQNQFLNKLWFSNKYKNIFNEQVKELIEQIIKKYIDTYNLSLRKQYIDTYVSPCRKSFIWIYFCNYEKLDEIKISNLLDNYEDTNIIKLTDFNYNKDILNKNSDDFNSTRCYYTTIHNTYNLYLNPNNFSYHTDNDQYYVKPYLYSKYANFYYNLSNKNLNALILY